MNNTSAHLEQPFNLENIHQAFAQSCYCYGRVVNNSLGLETHQETKLKQLAVSSLDLATQIQTILNGCNYESI